MADAGEDKKLPKEPSDAEILEDARKELKACVDLDKSERAKMLDDLKFCTLEQWPDDIRKERENDVENGPRPCLTIDKINQYIVQVVNDMRQGKPGINVRPQDDDADVETAKVLKGIVRNIEDQSNADIAYATAAENAVKIGLGYIRVVTEYAADDSFDQEIRIKPVPNAFSVYLGKHIMPDGSDAETGFVIEQVPVSRFREEFPMAKWKGDDFTGLGSEDLSYWRAEDTITVVEFFKIRREGVNLLFLADGSTITEDEYAKWPKSLPRPEVTQTRRSLTKKLKWYKLTGVDVLEKRDLPGKWIPIVEEIGRESQFDGQRILWGLVRPAKDSLRMYNYWASTITEKMALVPKTPYVGAKGQFKGMEERWKKANRVNYSYLEYDPIDVNGNAIPPPQRQSPASMEAAMLHQMQVIEHDVQTSLGMYKAAIGETESQQSGRAILALQRESDTGTYHFGANQGVSIRHVGRIIVDMIPHYYDTKRIVRILGEDGEPQAVQLDPSQEMAHRKITDMNGAIRSIHNPGVGEYDVSITVGPSYNTKRMEAAATFVELAKGATDPASAAVMRYLSVKNSDFTYSDEAAKMLKALLPPPVLQAIAPQGQQMPPEAINEIQKLHMAGKMMEEKLNAAVQENQQLKSGAAEAQSKIQVDAAEKQAKLEAQRKAEAEKIALDRAVAAEKAALAREIAQAEIALQRDVAQAEHERGLQKIEYERAQKAAAEGATKDMQMMPKVADTMGHMTELFGAITASLQAQHQTHQALLKAIQNPPARQVSVGSVRRDSAGRPTGATVTVQ